MRRTRRRTWRKKSEEVGAEKEEIGCRGGAYVSCQGGAHGPRNGQWGGAGGGRRRPTVQAAQAAWQGGASRPRQLPPAASLGGLGPLLPAMAPDARRTHQCLHAPSDLPIRTAASPPASCPAAASNISIAFLTRVTPKHSDASCLILRARRLVPVAYNKSQSQS